MTHHGKIVTIGFQHVRRALCAVEIHLSAASRRSQAFHLRKQIAQNGKLFITIVVFFTRSSFSLGILQMSTFFSRKIWSHT